MESVEAVFKKNPALEQIWVYGNSFESCLVAVVVPAEVRACLQQYDIRLEMLQRGGQKGTDDHALMQRFGNHSILLGEPGPPRDIGTHLLRRESHRFASFVKTVFQTDLRCQKASGTNMMTVRLPS